MPTDPHARTGRKEAIMAPTTTHAITAIVPEPKKGHGDIDGFAAICTCGDRIVSSLKTIAAQWGREHATYYNAKEA